MEKRQDFEHQDVIGKVEDSSVADHLSPEEIEQEKKLVRKIDRHILPCMWFMYLLSYMDRTNIGNAKIAGMDKDLNLDSNKYSVALTAFFVSYVVFEVPSNMILTRTRPSRYLAAIMFLWGAVTVGMAFTPNYNALVGFRFLMGLLESGFAPGILMILSSWYRKEEQSKRFAVYISAAILSGAFGGLLAGSITGGLHNVNGIAGWRWLFIIEGIGTIAVSVIAAFVLPDFPSTMSDRQLSAAERSLAVRRLEIDARSRSTEEEPHLTHLQALKLSVTNWRTWLLVIGYMAIVGSSTLSYFYPTLVNSLGYQAREAQYMTIPIFGVAFVATVITGYFADHNAKWRGVMLGSMMTVAMLCSIIICIVYNVKARYALLVIMASGLWASNGLSLSYASVTFSSMPRETKAVSLALVNAMGNLAQIYGAYLFPSKDEPKYLTGFGVISGMCLTGVLAYFSLHLLLGRFARRNRT
ncbi:hypothetical protein QQS21_003167 [Conoideocrella luteorostrata]|uniref:Major facilitator superfamily (MFS) profile domain-containing protein n=1 Tax=Conoideocrella luteorostrata TaxID=1105319 RepID=A0AAJ0CWF6_9HYPO|nr:hypothetical protein QQS21_003167 [Conoideocrella luteorostrata]